MSNKYKVESIVWKDHTYCDASWVKLSAIKSDSFLTTCTSIGYIIHEDKDLLVLVGCISGDVAGSIQVIAKALIASRTELGILEEETIS
jgi:hypothetical protein